MGHVIMAYEELEEAGRTSGTPGAYERCTRVWSELETLGIPPRERVLGDWFMEGDLGFVYAPRGLGKTWLSLGMATAIANGGVCGPWQALRPRRVLYVDGEMPCEALSSRLRGMGAGGGLSVLSHQALFHLEGRVLNLARASAQEELTRFLRREGVQVLFLDNLSCLFSGVAENDADAWESVLTWLLMLRRLQIAVVLVHHSGRNKETMRGTSRREDAAFWVLRLDPSESEVREGAQFISQFTKDRNSHREQPALAWKFHTHQPTGEVRVTTESSCRMEVLRQWIENGLTGAEDIAKEMGISKGTVSKMAKAAMTEGWLGKRGREYVLTTAG
jgi:hypothetical protein